MKGHKIVNVGVFCLCCFVVLGSHVSEARRAKDPKTKRVKYTKSKGGLKSLIELSKDRGNMIREYNEETKVYDKLIRAIDRGLLDEGLNGEDIRKKYGDPVVVVDGDSPGDKKWVYKPGSSSFFEKEKIYLIFNADDILLRWETPEE